VHHCNKRSFIWTLTNAQYLFAVNCIEFTGIHVNCIITSAKAEAVFFALSQWKPANFHAVAVGNVDIGSAEIFALIPISSVFEVMD